MRRLRCLGKQFESSGNQQLARCAIRSLKSHHFANIKCLHVVALYLADGRPYVCEDRWVNTVAVPELLKVDLSAENANEWLVQNAPFTRGDFAFSARSADAEVAGRLDAKICDALFEIQRTTWNEVTAITTVTLTYHPGYRMQTRI